MSIQDELKKSINKVNEGIQEVQTENLQRTSDLETVVSKYHEALLTLQNKNEGLVKEIKEVSSLTTTNSKDISGINEEQAVQNNRLGGVEGTIKNHSDHLQQIDDTLDGIQQTFGVVEERHNETTKQLKEVALQSSGLPQLVKELEDKVVAKSEDGLIKLKGQVTELEKKQGA